LSQIGRDLTFNSVKSRPICEFFHHRKKELNLLRGHAVFPSRTHRCYAVHRYLVKCKTSLVGAFCSKKRETHSRKTQ